MRWYFPSWCGDFRLTAGEDPKTSRLHVVDPTLGELELLGKFLAKARKKGFCDVAAGIVPVGETVLELDAPVSETGKLLAGRGRHGTITAVTSKGGTIVLAKSVDGEVVIDEREVDAAVTCRRPTLSCPCPVPGPDQRASEVLYRFCTREQWESWQKDRMIRCRGGLTGRLYEVLSRHHPTAARRGKALFDVAAQRVVHAYDWSVPAAEEVLVLKLAVELREDWVRNMSSCIRGAPDLFRNPFMTAAEQGLDGVLDTRVMLMATGAIVGGAVGGAL